MKLEWLREYRDFIEKLIKFANAYAGMYKQEKYYAKDIAFNSIQLQVMEYLLENEERNDKMAQIAQRLAITPSTFSKTVAKLEGKGMVEKYHTSVTRKDVIVKVTDFGRKAYQEYVDCVNEYSFKDIFAILDTVPKQEVEKFTQVLEIAADRWGTDRTELPAEVLVKIERKEA